MTPEFYNKIKTCHSLRYVKFDKLDNANVQMDTIEANSNVNQWILKLKHNTITQKVKNRLQNMLSKQNDNSLFVHSKESKLNSIPQITQTFKILPLL